MSVISGYIAKGLWLFKNAITRLNYGESGNGVTSGFSGIEIDRGTAEKASIGFNESIDEWIAGTASDMQSVVREKFLSDGWLRANETWTYFGADNPTFTMTVPTDVTAKYSKGMKLKLQQSQLMTSQWPLASDIADTIGSNNGALVGTPALSYTAAKYGNALTLTGANAVSLADNASLLLGKDGKAFTIEGKFKTSIVGSNKTFFFNGVLNSNYYGVLAFIDGTNVLMFNTYNGAGVTVAGSVIGTKNVCDGNEHSVVFTFNNNWGQIYLDGKLEASGYLPTPVFLTAGSNKCCIGSYYTTVYAGFFTGQIYDMFIINGYALDEQTCRTQYLANALTGNTALALNKNFIITDDPVYSNATTTTSMISYLPFDNNMNDFGYSNVSGTGPSAVSSWDLAYSNSFYKFGGYSAAFNGISSYISFTDGPLWRPTNDFTIGCWVKTSNASTFQTIFQSQYANTAFTGINFYIALTTGVVTMFLGNGVTSSTITATAVCDNAWHYIVYTQRSNWGTIYIDGVISGQGSVITPTFSATNYVRLGTRCDAGTNMTGLWFGAGATAYMDDFFFINGYAQDAGTIAAKCASNTAQGITPIMLESARGTLLTCYGGTDFALANRVISNLYYSMVQQPQGFNRNPDKWSIRLTGTGNYTQASPIATAWYNMGNLSLTVPVGTWDLGYCMSFYVVSNGGGAATHFISLSTIINAMTDSAMTAILVCSPGQYFGTTLSKRKSTMVSKKTTFYLVALSQASSSMLLINDNSTIGNISAICAYL